MRARCLAAALAAAALMLTGCGQAQSASSDVPAASQSTEQQAPKVYAADGNWFRVPDAYNEASVDKLAEKLVQIQEKFLTPNNRTFVALIPDKTEFAPEDAGPRLLSAPMLEQLRGKVGDAGIIDLSGTLELADYYKTDGHWRQENLQPVLDALGSAMDFSVNLEQFERCSLPDFQGALLTDIPNGQAPAEELVYLDSPAIQKAQVAHFQNEWNQVYDTSKDVVDYDVFLSGVDPVLTITCPEAQTDRELVIFRDSFGSSLAPLLCGTYRTITLVDLRYMASGMLPQYLEFTNQDVLFLYSAAVANRSGLLR